MKRCLQCGGPLGWTTPNNVAKRKYCKPLCRNRATVARRENKPKAIREFTPEFSCSLRDRSPVGSSMAAWQEVSW